MCINSFKSYLQNRLGIVIFLAGKFLRFAFFVLFLVYLIDQTGGVAGYNLDQALMIFLTFNLIDVFSQFLYREVYRFRTLITGGGFDLVLVKPWNALFRSLLGGTDLFDLITIPPLLAAVIWVGASFEPSILEIVLYLALAINGLIIATMFHIFVISLGIITLEVDHTIMIYRDLVDLGRLPVSIYKEPLRGVLTFIIPVGLMITFPSQVIFGMITLHFVVAAFFVSVILAVLAFRFWNYSLRFYTSASS